MKKAGSKKFVNKAVMLLAGIMAMMAVGILGLAGMADIRAQDGNIPIDEAHFPDGAFRSYVKNELAQGRDVLTQAECDAVTNIKIDGYYRDSKADNYVGYESPSPYKEIKSLEGIQYFTKLKVLHCAGIELTEMDLQKCPEVTVLMLDDCQLTSLSLPKGNKLKDLCIRSTPLTQLDMKNGGSLKSLWCDDVELEALDVSGCPDLQSLYSVHSKLKGIDVSACPLLTQLNCWDNQLTNLDVSSCPQLESLICAENQLTSMDLTANSLLESIRCDKNQIKKLDISTCSVLQFLDISDNHITGIDLTKLKELRTLNVSCNQLTSLDVSKNKKLEELNYHDNKIKTKTDLSNCKELCTVRAYGNKMQTTAASVKKLSIKENKNGGIICKWGKVKCDGYNVYVTPYEKTFHTKKTSAVIADCFLMEGENAVEVISYKKIGKITYYGRPIKKTIYSSLPLKRDSQ